MVKRDAEMDLLALKGNHVAKVYVLQEEMGAVKEKHSALLLKYAANSQTLACYLKTARQEILVHLLTVLLDSHVVQESVSN